MVEDWERGYDKATTSDRKLDRSLGKRLDLMARLLDQQLVDFSSERTRRSAAVVGTAQGGWFQ